MEYNTLIRLYKEFLIECERKEWDVEILIEEFDSYLACIKNSVGIEVQIFIELDLGNSVKLNAETHQSMLDYGVIRQKGVGDKFAKEVLEAFHQYLIQHSPKRKAELIIYKK